jgi:hypothetical protein
MPGVLKSRTAITAQVFGNLELTMRLSTTQQSGLERVIVALRRDVFASPGLLPCGLAAVEVSSPANC